MYKNDIWTILAKRNVRGFNVLEDEYYKELTHL